MPMVKLPEGLHSVIEHVELNKSGWWDLALRNVVRAAAWFHGKPFARAEMASLVTAAFRLEVAANRVNAQTEGLLRSGAFVSGAGDLLTVSEEAATDISKRVAAAEANEVEVRSAFESTVANVCEPLSPGECWDIFTQEYLLPIISVLGARTIQLIGDVSEDDTDIAGIMGAFLGRFEAQNRASLRVVIGEFLSPTDGSVRRYVIEHLDAYFLVQASGLTEESISQIKEFAAKPPAFKMFLDTNFLFSVLDLHENPSNESAIMMTETVGRVARHLNISLYVIPPTVDEIKRVLLAAQNDLAGLQLTASLAQVASEVGLSGIAMRYARANREAGHSVSAEDYFAPYLGNLGSVLKGKGITVYNAKLDEYSHRQDVIDSVHELSGGEGEWEGQRQRNYNAALHDSILWHFVDDLRPGSLESPLDAVYWVVTNDYRLLGFDRRRTRNRSARIGVCMHPADMVPLLQLWEPRSVELEQAMMGGLRLPFMFYGFDAASEAVSLRILKTLSRFENIGDLSPDTIKDIVLSDAVRSRAAQATTLDEETEIIHDALVDEHGRLKARLGEALDETAQLREKLRDTEARARPDAGPTPVELEARDSKISELEAHVGNVEAKNLIVTAQLEAMETWLETEQMRQRQRSARSSMAVRFGLGGALGIGALFAGLGWLWYSLRDTTVAPIAASLIPVWLFAWLLFVAWGPRNADVKDWALIATVRSLNKWLLGGLVGLALSVLGNAIYQAVIVPLF